MNHLTRAKSVFEMEIEELRGVLSRLDDNFNKAVNLMSQALDRGNKIVIVGVGKSGNIGAKIVATLNSTGTPTVLLDSLNALHGDLGIVQDGDVCIAMSFSGETSELLTLLPFIKRFELPIISMTATRAHPWPNTRISFWTQAFPGSLPAEPGPYFQHHGHARHGRRPRHGPGGSAPLHRADFAKRHPGGFAGAVPCSPG